MSQLNKFTACLKSHSHKLSLCKATAKSLTTKCALVASVYTRKLRLNRRAQKNSIDSARCGLCNKKNIINNCIKSIEREYALSGRAIKKNY